MGQDDKRWGVLVMPLAAQKEKWWVAVMEVGLDPELSKVVCAFRSGYGPNWDGI